MGATAHRLLNLIGQAIWTFTTILPKKGDHIVAFDNFIYAFYHTLYNALMEEVRMIIS